MGKQEGMGKGEGLFLGEVLSPHLKPPPPEGREKGEKKLNKQKGEEKL